MKRVFVVIAVAVLSTSLLSTVPAAATATECSFDAGTATVTVTPLDGSADILRRGDAIAVDGVDCGTATVTNTDTVDVLPSTGDAVTIDLRGGGFAPGLTDEGDGSSEIEFFITGSPIGTADLSLTIRGSAGKDTILAGSGPAPLSSRGVRTNDQAAVFDLNGDETVKDADMTVYRTDLAPTGIRVSLGGGDDVYSGIGFLGATPIPSLEPVALLRGGAGEDEVQPSFAGSLQSSIYLGDRGTDTMDLSFLPVTCGLFALTTGTPPQLSGGTTCLDYPATFTAARFEQLIGHAGTDLLGGAPGIQVIHALGGDDTLFASGGDQTLAAGPGVDTVVFDPLPVRIHASLAKGTANGDGHRAITGIENLYGSPFDDRLVGNGQANTLFGADGNDTILGKAGIDELGGDNGVDRCDPGAPGVGETVTDCEA